MEPRTQSKSRKYPVLIASDGAKICCLPGCGAPLQGRRRRWCSLEHSEEADVRCGYTWAIQRDLWARDGGICSRCRLDAAELQRNWEALTMLAKWIAVYGWTGNTLFEDIVARSGVDLGLVQKIRNRFNDILFRDLRFNHGTLFWEGDHIRPVSDGGGGCAIDGYRTLCVPCHKATTATMHRRRAQKRKLAQGAGVQMELLEA